MARMVLSLLVGLAGLSPVWSQEPVVWVASPWEHVLRSTEPGGAKSAEIVAARNEYEPLRVIIHAGAKALANVRVEAGALTGSAGQIEAKNVALFREHYINVFKPSPRSKAPTGWYPDALIPTAGGDPAAKYPPLPVSVEPATNQGFWADVYIPAIRHPASIPGRSMSRRTARGSIRFQ